MTKKTTGLVALLVVGLLTMAFTASAATLTVEDVSSMVGGASAACDFFGGLGLGLSLFGAPEVGLPIEVAVFILC